MTNTPTPEALRAAKSIQCFAVEEWDEPSVAALIDETTGLPALLSERDALMEACQIAADWLSRSTRIDDREQADDLRAAILKARGGES